MCSSTNNDRAVPVRRLLKAQPRTLLLASLLSGLFLPPLNAPAHAVESPAATMDTEQQQEAADKDLLLFWEEKELYVETATRIAKPITQVAENMTVVTAREIEQMNAHTVAEVLRRVPGVYVDLGGNDFGNTSQIYIQGSQERHVTVLLDGVVLNLLSSGAAETNSIPVSIIDRIEIIKGAASSVWGSALGGVINIITKPVGDEILPSGVLSGSYGEANSQDYRADLSGKLGKAGYFLHAGRQQSDGLRNRRDYRRDSLYAKLGVTPYRDLQLNLTVGYSDPSSHTGDIASGLGLSYSNLKNISFHTTGTVVYRISSNWSLDSSLRFLRQRTDIPLLLSSSDQLIRRDVYSEETLAADVKLLYTGGLHTAVVGMEASHGTLDRAIHNGVILSGPPFDQPANDRITTAIDKWAFFANDTLDLGKVAVTPGLRVDYNSVSGHFVSPSLGATYEVLEHTIARVSVARGFTSPPLSFTAGGGLFAVPNPGLRAEYGWSYQAGLESPLMGYVNIKGTLFRHDSFKEMAIDNSNPLAKTVLNTGDVTRQGYELEAETVPVYNLSIKAAHAYVHTKTSTPATTIIAPVNASPPDNYSYQIALRYDDRTAYMGQLTGIYIWWNQPAALQASYNTFIWDLNLNRRFHLRGSKVAEIFMSVHNLFGGASYTNSQFPNPGRWVEGGIKFRF